jgi:hypothetical protein
MDKKTLALLCVIALLAGSAVYLWVNRAPVIPAIEGKQTDAIVHGMEDYSEIITARIEAQDSQTKQEVKVIYERTRTKINALLPDAVARGLNDELALFRGMEAGSGGLDGD